MKIIRTDKTAQLETPFVDKKKNAPFTGNNEPEDGVVPDESVTPNIKEENTFYDESLPTLSPDNLNEYIVDNIEEEKEGELPTEVEIPTEEGVDTELIDTHIPTQDEQEEAEKYPEFGTILQAFRWAKENKKVIRIYYYTVKGTYLIREIEPHGDFWARTTLKRVLVTWDETAERMGATANGGIPFARAYRLENVDKYEFTGEDFEPKFNFSQGRRNYTRRLRRKRNKKEREQNKLL